MKFGRYLALMALSWVLAALFVTAFTLLVDAIGISPVRVAIAGFNAWKPLRQDYLRADRNLHPVFIEAFATALFENPGGATRPFVATGGQGGRPSIIEFG